MRTLTKSILLASLFLSIVPVFVCYKGINKHKNDFTFINQDSTIIGAWVSEEDNNRKFTFNADSTCSSIYLEEKTYNYTYKISNTSPQCGQIVDVNQYSNYLQLINVSDSTDRICYLLNGITSTHLSLSPIDRGGAFVFIRQ